jgi:hypothetical protein
VTWRAILTAFSTASAPELNSAERFSWSPGVRADHEAGVGELGDLVPDGVDHGGSGVAHADHGDSGAQVDQRIAVDVDEDGPLGPVDVEREDRAHPGGDGRRAPNFERFRLGTGQIGHESTCLVDLGLVHDANRS